jgi:ParB-like chromosome segregation protein Spo0J
MPQRNTTDSFFNEHQKSFYLQRRLGLSYKRPENGAVCKGQWLGGNRWPAPACVHTMTGGFLMQIKQYQGTQPQIAATPFNTIRAGPGLGIRPDERGVRRYERLIEKRGNIVPVTATYSETGELDLAGGHEAFYAYHNMCAVSIPVIIAETEGGADALLLALEMMGTHPAGHLAVSSCLCKLIDEYMVPRSVIAEALGKSLPWVSMSERVGRRLVPAVKDMLTCGKLCMRSATEIALLPAEAQKPFADKAVSQSLNKNQVSKWVSLYTDPGRSRKGRDAMMGDPVAYLKAAQKKKAAQSGYALFRRVLQRCKTAVRELTGAIATLPHSAMDDVSNQLQGLLDDVTELNDQIPDIFTRVNLEGDV